MIPTSGADPVGEGGGRDGGGDGTHRRAWLGAHGRDPDAVAGAGQRFTREVDSAAVVVNASTRFQRRGRAGLGRRSASAPTGLHARGPCGLRIDDLQYIVLWDGRYAESERGEPHDGCAVPCVLLLILLPALLLLARRSGSRRPGTSCRPSPASTSSSSRAASSTRPPSRWPRPASAPCLERGEVDAVERSMRAGSLRHPRPRPGRVGHR